MAPDDVWYLSATFPENTGQKVKVDPSDKVANYILFDCYDILKYFVLRNPWTTKFVVDLVLPTTPHLVSGNIDQKLLKLNYQLVPYYQNIPMLFQKYH